jgi:hypothetical protein
LLDTESNTDLSGFDAVLITDVLNPQIIYDGLKSQIPKEKLMLLELLHISDHDFLMERSA